MAQLVARLVRNEKVGGSNPPSSTTGRHPIRMSVFCMPGRVGVVPVVVLLVAPLVFRALRCDALWGPAAVCAGGRRPAREIATREPAARSGRSRGPPWPCHRPPAPRPGPAFCSSPVPSGPSGAHGHRSLAIRPLRCSPHGKRWGFCSIRSWLAGYLRRVAALMMQFPPFGGGEFAVCGGVVAKLQTHWVKRLQKRLVLLNGSAIWRNRSLSWCIVRT